MSDKDKTPAPKDVAVVNEADVTDPVVTASGEPFRSSGQTLVRTRPGTAFVPQGDLPVVTNDGVKVSKEQAQALLEQSDAAGGHVFIDDTEG